MIKRVKAKGFKGRDFDIKLEPLTIFIGPNGAGKTAVAQAVALAVQGFVPNHGRTNQAIFDAGADAGQDRFSVEVETSEKVAFYRRWKKNETGAVNMDFLVNGRKATAQAFEAEMGRCGRYAVADISSFMGLSDRKKIDEIFGLYPPPDDELPKIEGKLARKKEALQKKIQALKGAESALARLEKEKVDIQVKWPEQSMDELRKAYQQASIEKYRLQEMMDRAEAVKEVFEAEQPKGIGEGPEKGRVEDTQEVAAVVKEESGTAEQQRPTVEWKEVAIKAVERILGSIEAADCGGCAAKLTAKKVIKQFHEMEA